MGNLGCSPIFSIFLRLKICFGEHKWVNLGCPFLFAKKSTSLVLNLILVIIYFITFLFMKYWLLSQNALSVQYTEKLLKSSLEDEKYNIYMWNWLYNEDKIKTIDDVTLSNLDYPTKNEWRYSIYQFAKELNIWDFVILAQNKKQIYGIWEIIWNAEVNYPKENEKIINWPDKVVFSRKIKWLDKADNWFFTFDEKDKITQFRRTLAEISEIDYNRIKDLVSNNKNQIIQEEQKTETEEDKNEIVKNDELTLKDVVNKFDISLTELLNEKILEKIWNENFSIFEENDLNQILPSLRLEIIRGWKKALIDWDLKIELSQQMGELTKLFDSILKEKQDRDDTNEKNKQDREQKKDIFNKLTKFFVWETFWLAIIIILVWVWFLNISDTTLQVLTWATILQVWAMLTIVTKYLFPNN